MVQRWFFRMFGEDFLSPDFLTQCQIIANNFEIFIRFLGHGNIQAGPIVQQHPGNKFGIQVEAFQAAFLVVLDIQQYLDAAAEFLEHVHAAHGGTVSLLPGKFGGRVSNASSNSRCEKIIFRNSVGMVPPLKFPARHHPLPKNGLMASHQRNFTSRRMGWE